MRLISKLKNEWSLGAALALSLATVGAAHAEPTVTATTNAITLPKPGFSNLIWKPNTLPALLPFRQHAANWEKWALTQPANVSPLTDPDGRYCSQGGSCRRQARRLHQHGQDLRRHERADLVDHHHSREARR